MVQVFYLMGIKCEKKSHGTSIEVRSLVKMSIKE
jgi:hypothetical protein